MKNDTKSLVLILMGTILLHVLFVLEDAVLRMMEFAKQKIRFRRRAEKSCAVLFAG